MLRARLIRPEALFILSLRHEIECHHVDWDEQKCRSHARYDPVVDRVALARTQREMRQVIQTERRDAKARSPRSSAARSGPAATPRTAESPARPSLPARAPTRSASPCIPSAFEGEWGADTVVPYRTKPSTYIMNVEIAKLRSLNSRKSIDGMIDNEFPNYQRHKQTTRRRRSTRE